MKMLIDTDHLDEISSKMKISVSRRGLLSAAADAAEERRRSRNGAVSYRIEDLTGFTDEQMEEIWPAVNGKAKISLENGVVYAGTSAAVDPIPLFPVSSPVLFIFNQFNGMQPMAAVYEKVAAYTGWDAERVRRSVRAVFLKLCEVRVCEPGNPE